MSLMPTKKVTAGGLGSGAFGVPLGMLIAGWLGMGPEQSAALGGLLTALFGFIAAYLMPERPAE
jgi:PAB1-binding protein PBP1